MAFNFYALMRTFPQVPVVIAVMADGTEYSVLVPQSNTPKVSK